MTALFSFQIMSKSPELTNLSYKEPNGQHCKFCSPRWSVTTSQCYCYSREAAVTIKQHNCKVSLDQQDGQICSGNCLATCG